MLVCNVYPKCILYDRKLDKESPCELQYVGLPIIDQEVCKSTELGQVYKFTIGKDLPDIQLCAGHLEGGKDACQV